MTTLRSLVNNLDWTAPISALDFLREIGKHFRVNQMVKKDAVAARLESEQGISYTEFSYQILQALDFLELYRAHGCTLQTGGADQWGNLTAGVDLVHRVEGASVHCFTTPLLTDAAGTKFGKSEGNAVWLGADMTSPYAFYQYWINVEDASVVKLLKVFTDRTPDEIADLEKQVAEEPFRRTAQRTLASDVTTLVHGAEATAAVQAASEALFGKGDLTTLDPGTLGDATAELPGAELAAGTSLVDALVAVGLVDSRNAARRTIGEGWSLAQQRKAHRPRPGADGERLPGRPGRAAQAGTAQPRGRAQGLNGAVADAPEGRIPLSRNTFRVFGASWARGFVFLGGAGLMFSPSARQGGTDATAERVIAPRSRPVPGLAESPKQSGSSGSLRRAGTAGTKRVGSDARRADREFDSQAPGG